MADDSTRQFSDAPHGDDRPRLDGDPLLGSLIDGKYRVERLLGAGGMGKVYGGINIRTESPVAIKTLIPDLVRDESLVMRFEIEAKAASNLRHPNTIRIYDFGKEGETLFMVMELLDGISLEGLIRREKRIDSLRAIRIMRQVCSSLSEAHGGGLVHRDLKPDNIFLNSVGAEDDFVKVLDFGVAKLRDKRYGNATLTQAGMIFGTPRYMSPEQARAQDIDGRSDIYALGVILYECLTGAVPFDANDPVAVLVKHVNEPPPPFREVSHNLPDMHLLEGVVMRCLAKDADERYPTVEALRLELDAIESRLLRTATDPAGRPNVDTMALPAGHESTEPRRTSATPKAGDEDRPGAFTALGIDGTDKRDPTYALGDGTVALDTKKGSPLPFVIGGVVAVLAVAAIAIFALVGGGGDPADTPEDPATVETPTPPTPADEVPVEPERPPVDTGPAFAAIRQATDSALAAAVAAGPARVRAIRLESADDAEITASVDSEATTARLASESPAEAALPATWLVIDGDDADAAVRFAVSAPGRNDGSVELNMADLDGNPIAVELSRPRSSGGNGSSGGSQGNGGLANPYQR